MLPHLLRFFTERVWGLTRPNVLISVVGAGAELDLRESQRRKIAGIMDVALETGAWVLTNGLDSGVSRLLGDRRREIDNQVPLSARNDTDGCRR